MTENESIDRDDEIISLDAPRLDRDRDGVDSLRDTDAEQGDEEEIDDLYVYDQTEARDANADLDGDPPPQSRRGQDVGLVDAGQLPPPATGELEGEPDDPTDLGFAVGQGVAGRTRAGRPAGLGSRPEVEASG